MKFMFKKPYNELVKNKEEYYNENSIKGSIGETVKLQKSAIVNDEYFTALFSGKFKDCDDGCELNGHVYINGSYITVPIAIIIIIVAIAFSVYFASKAAAIISSAFLVLIFLHEIYIRHKNKKVIEAFASEIYNIFSE